MESGNNRGASRRPSRALPNDADELEAASPDRHEPSYDSQGRRPSAMRAPDQHWGVRIRDATAPVDRSGLAANKARTAAKRTDPQLPIPFSRSSGALPQHQHRASNTNQAPHTTTAQDSSIQKQLGAMSVNDNPVATMQPSRDAQQIEPQSRIIKRTKVSKRLPLYTIQLADGGGQVANIKLPDVADFVSGAELERFENHQFDIQAEAQAANDNRAKQAKEQEEEYHRRVIENMSSSSDLSSLRSSMFDDIAPPRRFALSPTSKRGKAHDAAMARQYDDVGIFEIEDGKYEATINPNARGDRKWIRTNSLITARTIETGVDDRENPEFVAYIDESNELAVQDTGDDIAAEADDEPDHARGTMPARRQKERMKWRQPLVPASGWSRDFVGVSSVVKKSSQDNLVVYVEAQRQSLMNPAIANVSADFHLESEGDEEALVGQITSTLIDKTVLDSDGKPGWLNRTSGPPTLLIEIFDSEGQALPGLRKNAAQLEQGRILIISEFWFEAEYDTEEFLPAEDLFFKALPQLDNGYAFEGTILVSPNQLKDAENEEDLITKWKKSGFEVWQEWKEEKARLLLGRAWPGVERE